VVDNQIMNTPQASRIIFWGDSNLMLSQTIARLTTSKGYQEPINTTNPQRLQDGDIVVVPVLSVDDVKRISAIGTVPVSTRLITCVTMSAPIGVINELIKLRVAGIVRVSAWVSTEKLLECLENVGNLKQYYETELLVETMLKKQEGREHDMSPQEQRVVDGLLEGLSNKQIADRLHISAESVKKYLSKTYKKYGVRSRVELAMKIPRPSNKPD
jgi:DNA-binding NarL/FixJ family response regulator